MALPAHMSPASYLQPGTYARSVRKGSAVVGKAAYLVLWLGPLKVNSKGVRYQRIKLKSLRTGEEFFTFTSRVESAPAPKASEPPQVWGES